MEPIPPKLLFITDDEAKSTDDISKELKKTDHAITTISAKDISSKKTSNTRFDLILLQTGNQADAVLSQIKSNNLWQPTPIILIYPEDQINEIPALFETGGEDFVSYPSQLPLLQSTVAKNLERSELRFAELDHRLELEAEQERVEALLKVIVPLGVALTAEQDFNQLLEKIICEGMSLCNADAGTLYLRTPDNHLQFVIVYNNSLKLARGGSSGEEITFPPLPLYDPKTGEPNHKNVAAHAALTGETANIPDAYNNKHFDFSGTKAFDKNTGYRSMSFLTVPLKNNREYVIGILQLINSIDGRTKMIVPFSTGMQEMVDSLASLATVALEGYLRDEKMRKQIDELRIEIDVASRTTQVAEITETDYFAKLQSMAQNLRKIADKE